MIHVGPQRAAVPALLNAVASGSTTTKKRGRQDDPLELVTTRADDIITSVECNLSALRNKRHALNVSERGAAIFRAKRLLNVAERELRQTEERVEALRASYALTKANQTDLIRQEKELGEEVKAHENLDCAMKHFSKRSKTG